MKELSRERIAVGKWAVDVEKGMRRGEQTKDYRREIEHQVFEKNGVVWFGIWVKKIKQNKMRT